MPSAMMDCAGQEDLHEGLGCTAPGSKEKTGAHPAPCDIQQMGSIVLWQMYGVV